MKNDFLAYAIFDIENQVIRSSINWLYPLDEYLIKYKKLLKRKGYKAKLITVNVTEVNITNS